ncbi:hypothetical protein SR41_07875 [Sphingomonas melonis]|uniref:Uncharacterized protein n=1 Tax=Sphingomonas melonis TaxID=152682 RepID=A0A0D1KVQ6_9SPHN|nr:hypothetical protein SR41_07875 [Sphingomonas melonis]
MAPAPSRGKMRGRSAKRTLTKPADGDLTADAPWSAAMHANRLLAAAALLLAGCAKPAATQQDLDSLDKELTAGAAGNERDPALTAALRDQIMVDPALTRTANTDAVRPPSRPDPLSIPADPTAGRPDGVTAADLKPTPPAKGDCPSCKAAAGALTLAELAARQRPADAGCAQRVSYSATWAARLPAAVPLYPDARVQEAAGNDACGLRVVSFASSAPAARILDWYNARVTRAGYSAEHQAQGDEHVLGGTRGDAAYVVHVTPGPGGGSRVDLLVR